VTGRFLQNEPLLNRRPFSHYLYANQNPISFVDPFGLANCPAEPQLCSNIPQTGFQSDPSNCSGCSGSFGRLRPADAYKQWSISATDECDPCEGLSDDQVADLIKYLESLRQQGLDPFNAQNLFPDRSSVNAREFLQFGAQNPDLPVMGNSLQGQLVILGQMQSRGYEGGPYAFTGGPGYTDEWGFKHQTFCMSCHDPINPVAQARLGTATYQTEWWKFGAETAVDLATLFMPGPKKVPVRPPTPRVLAPIAIGENMERVVAMARRDKAQWLKMMKCIRERGYEAMMRENERWLRRRLGEGRTVLDYGLDVRRLERSTFYGMERNVLQEYIQKTTGQLLR
jgi:hypothetical protein